MQPRVAIRCDGFSEIGLGHVVRCLALANALRGTCNADPVFVSRDTELGPELIASMGFRVHRVCGPLEVADVVTKLGARAVVFDIRDDTTATDLHQLRAQGVLTVSIDDVADRRLAADLAFLPPTPQVQRLSWSGATGRHFIGFEWVLLRPEFADVADGRDGSGDTILITGGGTDPRDITRLCCEATAQLHTLKLLIVLGPGYARWSLLEPLLATLPHDVEIHRAPSNMAALMSRADVALASFGSSAYELAAVGVPAAYVGLTDDHVESAGGLEAMGIATNVGVVDRVSAADVARAAQALLEDAPRRERMRSLARSLVDGRGAQRVAATICDTLKPK